MELKKIIRHLLAASVLATISFNALAFDYGAEAPKPKPKPAPVVSKPAPAPVAAPVAATVKPVAAPVVVKPEPVKPVPVVTEAPKASPVVDQAAIDRAAAKQAEKQAKAEAAAQRKAEAKAKASAQAELNATNDNIIANANRGRSYCSEKDFMTQLNKTDYRHRGIKSYSKLPAVIKQAVIINPKVHGCQEYFAEEEPNNPAYKKPVVAEAKPEVKSEPTAADQATDMANKTVDGATDLFNKFKASVKNGNTAPVCDAAKRAMGQCS